MELHARGVWPAQVPSMVLAESLTGNHRRDFHANRLLAACQMRDVTEPHAREAARQRTATGRRAQIRTIGMAADAHSCMCARSDGS